MKKRDFYAIGHITNDLEPASHLGGGVSYSGVAAARLGISSHIITECPPNHSYIQELTNLGVKVHRLPAVSPRLESAITSFRNFYDEKGRRHQIVSQRQDDINTLDLPHFPAISKDAIILVAPVVGEVNVELYPFFAKQGLLVVTPQGYFRSIEEDGMVKRSPWKDIEALSHAKITILSDEDLTFDQDKGMDTNLLNKIREYCQITVLTQGENGATIFEKGKSEVHVGVFRLEKNELRDFTGAGDSYASAFVDHYSLWGNLKEAGVFASLYSALKIRGLGGEGIGLATIPTREQVQTFVRDNEERFNEFLRENGLRTLSLFPEGNGQAVERR